MYQTDGVEEKPIGPEATEQRWLFALEAYRTARNEIDARMQSRERFLELYVVGSVATLAATLTTTMANPWISSYIFLVSPILAVLVTTHLLVHVIAIEGLAEHIRRDINPVLIALDAWVPHWDWHTRADFRVPSAIEGNKDIETLKTNARVLDSFVAIHLPSFLSIVVFAIYQVFAKPENGGVLGPPTLYMLSVVAFVVSLFLFFWAIHNTLQINKIRNATKKHTVSSADWWKGLVELEKSKSD